MSEARRLVVIGGGGHAKVVIDVLRAGGWEVVGYTDPSQPAGSRLGEVPCLGDDRALERALGAGVRSALVALGDNALRHRLAEAIVAMGFRLVNALHPSAQISPWATLGRGLAVMPGAVVNAAASLGDCSIVNTAASVDHDCLIGQSVHIAPGAHLAGCVTVGDQALIGVGAVVGRGRPLAIGRGAIVGAGAVVLCDVEPGTTVVGNPARPLHRDRNP
jgi:UDP-perosamine 4-acetyltransferase